MIALLREVSPCQVAAKLELSIEGVIKRNKEICRKLNVKTYKSAMKIIG